MSHYITCAQCFEPSMDVANLRCYECGYESGMSENKALRELTEQQAERIKEMRELLEAVRACGVKYVELQKDIESYLERTK